MSPPRPSVYAADGNGRDTYIGGDNGGLYDPYSPGSAALHGSFRSVRQSNYCLANLGAKGTNYNYNGTGRDSYIG